MADIDNTTIQKEEPDLYKRSIKGGYWVIATRAVTFILGFFKFVIVFNFLYKENLELILFANLLMGLLVTFSESGFDAALIQKKESIKNYLDTAWVIGILRGILLFIIMFFVAPVFASIKAKPEDVSLAISVIRVMAACFLIRAFQNIGIVYFQKELQFYKTFWLKIAVTLADIVLSVTLVLIYRSVWGYVVARLISAVVNLIVSYVLSSYRPRLHFELGKAKELWSFGKWVFSNRIIGYFLSEGDNWFVLSYLDTEAFKLYRSAYNFSNMPATHLSYVISQVTFPAYSKIQNDVIRLRKAYLKTFKLTSFLSVPVSFAIFVFGPDFVRLFLIGESHAMIFILQILALKGLMGSLSATWPPLFRSMGKPKYILYLMLTCLSVLVLTIYPFTVKWGITGTALSTILAGLITAPVGYILLCRILECSLRDIIKILFWPIAVAGITGIILLGMKTLLLETTIVTFFMLGAFSIFLYGFIFWLTDCLWKLGIRQIIAEYWQTTFNKNKF